MAVQGRVEEGKKFEELICKTYGLTKTTGNPLLKWPGKGSSNFKKLLEHNYDPNSFQPILEKSKFTKYDAINQNGDKVEIKKYTITKLKSWQMYSEPIIKVAPKRSEWKEGHFVFDNIGVKEYNDFIERFMETEWWHNNNQVIIDNMSKTSIGVYCIDGFIPIDKFEFKWVLKENGVFEGYKRLTLMFKLKE